MMNDAEGTAEGFAVKATEFYRSINALEWRHLYENIDQYSWQQC